jgi:hypothetical protein
MTAPLPFPLPRLDALLLRPRRDALAVLLANGWRPYAIPISIDPELRRRLNLDLGEPDLAWHDETGALAAVARVEADRAGAVTVVELTATAAIPPERVADVLLPGLGEPRVGGPAEAREWVWGPEAGNGGAVAGEPVRLWAVAERAYGDRLWAVASVVRRAV